MFNLNEDPSENIDISDKFTEKRNELITAWEEYSKNNGVIYDPLDVNAILKHD